MARYGPALEGDKSVQVIVANAAGLAGVPS
jgi:hypothetical protein